MNKIIILSVAFLGGVIVFQSNVNSANMNLDPTAEKSEAVMLSQLNKELQEQEGESPTQIYTQPECQSRFTLASKPNQKKQHLKLSKNVSMVLTQLVAIQSSKYGANIATNIICQKLNGAKYTGSEQEWAQFIQQAASGINRTKVENVRLELLGGKDKVFNSTLNHKEYKFVGMINGQKQEIYNLALLNKHTNSVLTISVSGARKGKKAVVNEYKRVVNSLTFPK